jgi:hypothetical protein
MRTVVAALHPRIDATTAERYAAFEHSRTPGVPEIVKQHCTFAVFFGVSYASFHELIAFVGSVFSALYTRDFPLLNPG